MTNRIGYSFNCQQQAPDHHLLCCAKREGPSHPFKRAMLPSPCTCWNCAHIVFPQRLNSTRRSCVETEEYSQTLSLLVELERVCRFLDCGFVCLLEVLVENDIPVLAHRLHARLQADRCNVRIADLVRPAQCPPTSTSVSQDTCCSEASPQRGQPQMQIIKAALSKKKKSVKE